MIECLCAHYRPQHVDPLSRQEGSKDHRALKTALDAWFQEARQAEWKNSADVKASYAHASIVGADRVVFNIKGNAYRLVVAVDYQRSTVFIKWLGSHKQYDAIDVRTVQYATETHQD
jgi:mRNA interferase HigB